MAAPRALSHAEAALAIARALGPVLPVCYHDDGVCACGGRYDRDSGTMVPHIDKELGKAPVSALVRNGLDDATRNSAAIDRWWRTKPRAGVAVDLARSNLMFIDPDSADALAEAEREGMTEGGMRRDSRNVGFLFRRPADCPVISITKGADGTDLEIRTTGYAVVWNTHQDGSDVRIDLHAPLQDGPARAVERLKVKAAEKAAQDAIRAQRRAERANDGTGSEPPVRLHQRGQRRWSGDLVQMKNGSIDRSDSLYYIALDSAECGASEAGVRWAVENRDVELGWRKYADRDDAEDRYQEIAERAVAYVIEREKAPQLRITKPADVPDDVAALRSALETAEARIAYLERALMDRDDRLEVLEPIVTQIDEIIARPEFETDADGNVVRYGPTSDDKLVDIGVARWMPHWRAKKEANGELPTIALGYLEKVLGMPRKRISKSLDRQSSDDPNDGAPFRKHVTRRFIEAEARWESSLEIVPWGDSPAETLRAAATYDLPERPKRGGSKEAAEARWGRCDNHDNREVRIKGFCPECGKVVGERIMTLAEFDALNVQLGHSEEIPPHVSNANLIERQNGHSEHAHGPADRLNVQAVDSGPPLSLLDYAATRAPDPPPARCPAPNCRAMEYRQLADGSYRCLKSAHDPSAYLLAAVSGGSE